MDGRMKNLHDPMIMTLVRAEGFPRQHMRVVPMPTRRALARHPLLTGLLVTDAGHFPAAKGHLVERREGVGTHLLIFCRRGAGWVRTRGGAVAPVRAGEAVWLPADVPHAYGADDEEPWTITWVHCQGSEAVAWRGLLGWEGAVGEPSVGRQSADQLEELGLDELYRPLEHGYAVPELVAAAAALRRVLSSCVGLGRVPGRERSAAQRVALVGARLREHPERAVTLAELAAAAGVSVPHFSQLFRRQMGYSPLDYVIRRRVQRACQLLDTTTLSVAVIAAEAGYEDPFYFTRAFRRVMGCSPRAYRQQIKG